MKRKNDAKPGKVFPTIFFEDRPLNFCCKCRLYDKFVLWGFVEVEFLKIRDLCSALCNYYAAKLLQKKKEW